MKRLSLFLFLFMVIAIPVNAGVYDSVYNIDGAISYAEKYAYNYNLSYHIFGSDCTNFVSQCIADANAGGIAQGGYFSPDGGAPNHHPWTVPEDLFNLLIEHGYKSSYYPSSAYIPANSIQVGDIVFFDWNDRSDDYITHAAIIVGRNNLNVPCYAGHTENRWMEPLHLTATLTGPVDMLELKSYEDWDLYIIHMTDSAGFTDISSKYIGKTITLKSTQTGKYVSSNTDDPSASVNIVANRDVADTWERFVVTEGAYGAVGLKAVGNNSFLSTRRDINSEAAPIMACVSSYQQWESFRIFEKDGYQYIQSQCTGKWVQANMEETDYPLMARGAAPSTWERFIISVYTPDNNSSTPSTPSTPSTLPDTSHGGDPEPTPTTPAPTPTLWIDDNGPGNIDQPTPISSPVTVIEVNAPNNDSDDGLTPGGITFLIEYDANGGTGAPMYVIAAPDEYIQISSQIPVRPGYTFLGWSTSPSGEVETIPGNIHNVQQSLIFYAVWIKDTDQTSTPASTPTPTPTPTPSPTPIYITYDANGGTGAPPVQDITQNDTISNVYPARDGYIFLGWSVTEGSGIVNYRPGEKVTITSNIYLYAVWEGKHYILHKYETDDKSSTDIDVKYGDVYVFEVPSIKENYIFQGWECNGEVYNPGEQITITGETSITAMWISEAFKYSAPSTWAKDEIVEAYNRSLIPEYITYDYISNATRLDFARIIYHVIDIQTGSIKNYLADKGHADSSDNYSIPAYFNDVEDNPNNPDGQTYDIYITSALYELDIIKGKGDHTFAPNDPLTRQEAAVMVDRVHQLLGYNDVSDDRYYGYREQDPYVDDDQIASWALNGVYNLKCIEVMQGTGGNKFSPQDVYTREQCILTMLRMYRYLESHDYR